MAKVEHFFDPQIYICQKFFKKSDFFLSSCLFTKKVNKQLNNEWGGVAEDDDIF